MEWPTLFFRTAVLRQTPDLFESTTSYWPKNPSSSIQAIPSDLKGIKWRKAKVTTSVLLRVIQDVDTVLFGTDWLNSSSTEKSSAQSLGLGVVPDTRQLVGALFVGDPLTMVTSNLQQAQTAQDITSPPRWLLTLLSVENETVQRQISDIPTANIDPILRISLIETMSILSKSNSKLTQKAFTKTFKKEVTKATQYIMICQSLQSEWAITDGSQTKLPLYKAMRMLLKVSKTVTPKTKVAGVKVHQILTPNVIENAVYILRTSNIDNTKEPFSDKLTLSLGNDVSSSDLVAAVFWGVNAERLAVESDILWPRELCAVFFKHRRIVESATRDEIGLCGHGEFVDVRHMPHGATSSVQFVTTLQAASLRVMLQDFSLVQQPNPGSGRSTTLLSDIRSAVLKASEQMNIHDSDLFYDLEQLCLKLTVTEDSNEPLKNAVKSSFVVPFGDRIKLLADKRTSDVSRANVRGLLRWSTLIKLEEELRLMRRSIGLAGAIPSNKSIKATAVTDKKPKKAKTTKSKTKMKTIKKPKQKVKEDIEETTKTTHNTTPNEGDPMWLQEDSTAMKVCVRIAAESQVTIQATLVFARNIIRICRQRYGKEQDVVQLAHVLNGLISEPKTKPEFGLVSQIERSINLPISMLAHTQGSYIVNHILNDTNVSLWSANSALLLANAMLLAEDIVQCCLSLAVKNSEATVLDKLAQPRNMAIMSTFPDSSNMPMFWQDAPNIPRFQRDYSSLSYFVKGFVNMIDLTAMHSTDSHMDQEMVHIIASNAALVHILSDQLITHYTGIELVTLQGKEEETRERNGDGQHSDENLRGNSSPTSTLPVISDIIRGDVKNIEHAANADVIAESVKYVVKSAAHATNLEVVVKSVENPIGLENAVCGALSRGHMVALKERDIAVANVFQTFLRKQKINEYMSYTTESTASKDFVAGLIGELQEKVVSADVNKVIGPRTRRKLPSTNQISLSGPWPTESELRHAIGNEMATTFISGLSGGTLVGLFETFNRRSKNGFGLKNDTGVTQVNTDKDVEIELQISWLEFESIVAANQVKGRLQWQSFMETVTDAVLNEMNKVRTANSNGWGNNNNNEEEEQRQLSEVLGNTILNTLRPIQDEDSSANSTTSQVSRELIMENEPSFLLCRAINQSPWMSLCSNLERKLFSSSNHTSIDPAFGHQKQQQQHVSFGSRKHAIPYPNKQRTAVECLLNQLRSATRKLWNKTALLAVQLLNRIPGHLQPSSPISSSSSSSSSSTTTSSFEPTWLSIFTKLIREDYMTCVNVKEILGPVSSLSLLDPSTFREKPNELRSNSSNKLDAQSALVVLIENASGAWDRLVSDGSGPLTSNCFSSIPIVDSHYNPPLSNYTSAWERASVASQSFIQQLEAISFQVCSVVSHRVESAGPTTSNNNSWGPGSAGTVGGLLNLLLQPRDEVLRHSDQSDSQQLRVFSTRADMMNQSLALSRLLTNRELGLDVQLVVAGIRSSAIPLDVKLKHSSSITQVGSEQQMQEQHNEDMINSSFLNQTLTVRLMFGILMHSIRSQSIATIRHQDLHAQVTSLSRMMEQLTRSSMSSQSGAAIPSPVQRDITRERQGSKEAEWDIYLNRVEAFVNSLLVEDEGENIRENSVNGVRFGNGSVGESPQMSSIGGRAAALHVVLQMVDAVRHFDGDTKIVGSMRDRAARGEVAARAIEEALAKLVKR